MIWFIDCPTYFFAYKILIKEFKISSIKYFYFFFLNINLQKKKSIIIIK